MHLTPETPAEDLVALSTPSRSSNERRRELERLGSLCTARDLSLRVRLTSGTAAARPVEDESSVEYEIQIPTQKYDQRSTDLPADLWDRSIQVAFLFHELGHVYYSDFERFGECKREVAPQWRDLFRNIYNAAEDGVVETQIAMEFNVTDDLVVLNETLVSRADQRHREYVDLFDLERTAGETPVQTYTVFEALSVGLLDRGFVDSGRFEAILDPEVESRVVQDGYRDALVDLVPSMDAFVAEMLSTPDGRERVDRAREFFETVRPVFESLPPLQSGRVQTAPVRPPDARAAEGWKSVPADQLPDNRTASRHVESSRSGRGSPRDGENGQERDGGGGRASQRPPGRVETAELRRRARRRTAGRRSRGGSGRSAFEQEARRLLGLLADETTDLEDVVVVDPAEDGGDTERWERAVARSRRLESDLRTQLRRERRPRDRPGARAGRLDGRRLVAATRGAERVFTRRETGTRKDYTCLIVLDRSGSMGDGVVFDDGPIETAEAATAQLSTALSAVGVDVSVLSVWQGYPCLELPFGADPAENVDRLMTGRADFGTPLSDALAIARERVDDGRGSAPFVVVITDGEPDDPDRYRRQLDRCTFPVLGLYIGSESDGDSRYFDRLVSAEEDAVERRLQSLIRRLFAAEA